MSYYKNNETESIGYFSHDPGAGWTELTEIELEEFELQRAKDEKIGELKNALISFTEQGYKYQGEPWNEGFDYPAWVIIRASDEALYRGLQNSNLGNNPVSSPSWWERYDPVFLLTEDVVSNVLLKDNCSQIMPDRYHFYDDRYTLINFVGSTEFVKFKQDLFGERDRVMVKFNKYKLQIEKCENIQCVEDIQINFSAS